MAGQTTTDFLFPIMSLPPSLINDLRRLNPWWFGQPLPVLPSTRRHLVQWIHQRLQSRLAPIVVVRGPRQIGKTIAQFHVMEDLLHQQKISPKRILRIQFDERLELGRLKEPILRVVDWYEHNILGQSLNQAARQNEPAFLFLDEVQNLPNWTHN